MKIRMITRMAGPRGNCEPGGIVDVDPKEAKELVEGKYATYVDQPLVTKPKPKKETKETATDASAETRETR